MSNEFQREYLVRVPLPLAQLYGRAYNTKDGRGRHDNCFYLFEALVKLATGPLIAGYLDEIRRGNRRLESIDQLLVQLALPSLGHWAGFLRELARHFGSRADAASHPLGHVWEQLNTRRRDLPGVLALYQRIKNGPEGKPAGDESCSLLQLIESLVQYRNAVFGHGAGRVASFYEDEMGPLLFPAVNDVLAEGTFDLLGPSGSKLVYLVEVKTIESHRVELGMRELTGLQGERMAPLVVDAAEAEGLVPNRVAVLWPGRKAPLPLDPLLVYRENELSEDVLFLNRDRNGRQVEYLSYCTGQTERDMSMAPAMARLLSQITGEQVSEERLDQLRENSLTDEISVESLTEPSQPATRILGDFEILTELGRGGMGVVYLARQLSLGRLVALKMLPADMAGDDVALARFRREMRALGRCEHPNIVKVLSSGLLPDGQLYYAMEYVPGADLEQIWCELAELNQQGSAKALGGTSWRRAIVTASGKIRQRSRQKTDSGRLEATKTAADKTTPESTKPDTPPVADFTLPPLPELPSHEEDPGGYVRRVAMMIRDAARAVQSVHDQHIVHRDIKPANLMLTPDGSRVVLMDFGLAKSDAMSLTASHSAGLLGTLRYSAPEQLAAAQMKVGPQADVRALGITMWELLTRGRLFGEAEDERQLTSWVLGRDVPRLRTIDSSLDADLEAIVSRATERGEEHRLQSAREMADYLELYLQGKPIPIRIPGIVELAKRWVREHAVAAASAAAAILAISMAVVVAFVLITREKDKAIHARNQALESESQARHAERETRTAKEKAETRLGQIQKANEMLGSIFANLNPEEVNESDLLLREALVANLETVIQQLAGDSIGSPLTVAETQQTLGKSLIGLGEYDRAVAVLEVARDTRRDQLGLSDLDTLETMNDLAVAYREVGQLDKALPLFEQSLELRNTMLGPNDVSSLECMDDLAIAHNEAGQLDKALSLQERTLELRKAILGPDHPSTLNSMNNLANTYRAVGQLDEALQLHEKTLERQTAILGLGNHNTRNCMNNLAVTYLELGQHDKAIQLWEQELALTRAQMGPEHPSTLSSMSNLAGAYQVDSQLDKAESLHRQALELKQIKLGPDHPRTIASMNGLALTYDASGQLEKALPLYQKALKSSQSKMGVDHPLTLTCMGNLANGYRAAGRLDEALPLYAQALEMRRAKLGPNHPDTLESMQELATAYRTAGQLDKAVPLHEETMELQEANLGSDHPNMIPSMNSLAAAYGNAGQLDKALPLYKRTVELAKATMGPDDPNTLIIMNNLAVSYLDAGQPELALEILEQTIVLMTEILGPEHFLSLDTSGTLGRNYLLLGRISEALPLLERAYRERNDFRMKTRHGTHLFHAYDRSGKTDQAVALTRELSASMFEQLSVASTRLMVAEQMAKFSRYLLEADVFEDAIPLLRESLTIKQAALPNKWQTFDTQSTLGEALLGQRKYAQAEPLLLDGYQGLLEHQEEIPPHRKERLTESLPRLVQLYESWDASEPEAGYDKKAAEWKQKLDEFQQAR